MSGPSWPTGFFRGLNGLKGFKDFSESFLSAFPKQTPPPFGLLGGAAERNFDHPSQPPLS